MPLPALTWIWPEVAKADKDVDVEYATAIRELITYMMEDPRSIGRVMHVIWALRPWRRVGDHAVISRNKLFIW